MAKSFAGLKADALVIKNEVEESKNTATRIGTMFSGVVEKMENVERETIEQANAQFVGNIVNNLTDGGADKALSAEMGKELGHEVEGLSHKTSQIRNIEEDVFAIADKTGFTGFIVKNGIVDALGLGENLSEFIRVLTKNKDERIIDTEDAGLHVVDEQGNKVLSAIPIIVEEEGFFVIDTNNNIGACVRNGQFDFNKDVINDEDYLSVVRRTNDNVREIRDLSNSINASIPSLLALAKTEVHTEKEITVPSIGACEKRLVRIGLHYGAERGTPDECDIFFDGACDRDFGDVRFFDESGNILNAQFGEAVNMSPIFDSRLNKAKAVLSDGTLVGYDRGVVLSGDMGKTWNVVEGTTDISPYPSDVNKLQYMMPVFVDSNDNIYAYRSGILYKLSSSSNYTTIKEVLVFSFEYNGVVIYPDVRDGFAEDINGNIYFGPYQEVYRAAVYVSHDNGDTFNLSWLSWNYSSEGYEKHAQHIHHIHASPFTSEVYVGVDDGCTTWNGPMILKTSDGGLSWTDITIKNHAVRGRDYYPTYFGDGSYKLGGGETCYFGGNMIYRSTDDEKYKSVMLGVGGVRTFGDFGDDSLIIAGVQSNTTYNTRQLVYSVDKGNTWKTFLSLDVEPFVHSGAGFRKILSAKVLKGDDEKSVIITQDTPSVNAMVLYKGGEHYYRDAYVLLENVEDKPVKIIAKTGYMMPYPFRNLKGLSDIKPVYSIPLNDGFGRSVCDSEGHFAVIKGTYSWSKQESLRFGDYNGDYSNKPFVYSSALKVANEVSLGKIGILDFSSDYTITFFLNEKARRQYEEPADRFDSPNDGVFYSLFNIGDKEVYRYNYGIGLCQKNDVNRRISINIGGFMPFSDNFFFIAIVVSNNAIKVSVNGNSLLETLSVNTFTELNKLKLSEAPTCIGSNTRPMAGYVSNINVYNAQLTERQINALYKGYYYY